MPTGQHTGRSPNDKFIVQEPSSADRVWWSKVNRPIAPRHFDALHQRLLNYVEGRELFVQDCYAGADPRYRLAVRIITEQAWHSLFARHMFIDVPGHDGHAGALRLSSPSSIRRACTPSRRITAPTPMSSSS